MLVQLATNGIYFVGGASTLLREALGSGQGACERGVGRYPRSPLCGERLRGGLGRVRLLSAGVIACSEDARWGDGDTRSCRCPASCFSCGPVPWSASLGAGKVLGCVRRGKRAAGCESEGDVNCGGLRGESCATVRQCEDKVGRARQISPRPRAWAVCCGCQKRQVPCRR